MLGNNSGIKSFGSVRYHNFYYALWLQYCLIFHIKKKCDIVKVLKKGGIVQHICLIQVQ